MVDSDDIHIIDKVESMPEDENDEIEIVHRADVTVGHNEIDIVIYELQNAVNKAIEYLKKCDRNQEDKGNSCQLELPL